MEKKNRWSSHPLSLKMTLSSALKRGWSNKNNMLKVETTSCSHLFEHFCIMATGPFQSFTTCHFYPPPHSTCSQRPCLHQNWPNGIIYHQPRFPWNSRGFPFPKATFGGPIGRVRSRPNLTRAHETKNIEVVTMSWHGRNYYCFFLLEGTKLIYTTDKSEKPKKLQKKETHTSDLLKITSVLGLKSWD